VLPNNNIGTVGRRDWEPIVQGPSKTLRVNLAPAATPSASSTGTLSPAGAASDTGPYVNIPLRIGWEGRRAPEGRPYFVDVPLTEQRGLNLCRRRSPGLDSYLQDGRSDLHPPAVFTSLATTLEQLPGTTMAASKPQ